MKRKGRFILDAEGTLDGDVELSMTGHRAILARDNWLDMTLEDAATSVRERLVQRLPTAEVDQVTSEHLRELSATFVVHFHVHVPGYADSVGSRLALPLNFFEANVPEVFTNETRRYPVFFDFAEEEHDDIEIGVPAGFVLDGASAPAPVGQPGDMISARYGVTYQPKTRTLSYHRDHVVGHNGVIAFRAESYPVLKNLFSRIHRSDVHQLVLKPKAAKVSPTPSAPVPATEPAKS